MGMRSQKRFHRLTRIIDGKPEWHAMDVAEATYDHTVIVILTDEGPLNYLTVLHEFYPFLARASLRSA